MEEEPIVFVADVEVKHVALARYELAEQGIPYDSRMDGLVKYASFEDRSYPEYFLPFIAARIKNMCDRDFELTSGCISAVGKITLKPGMTVQAIGLQTLSRPEDTGSITGIRTGNFHPAAMIRGVLNGMAEELYELYRLIETGTGTPKTKLIASGNAVRKNPAFQKILEERFRMPLTLVQNEEEAAYGASLCALYSSGQLS